MEVMAESVRKSVRLSKVFPCLADNSAAGCAIQGGNSFRPAIKRRAMSDKPITQAISSGSDQRKNIPVVTVESFYRAHAEKLHLKLEGKRVGFHRKIREPTINRPGLALSGFFSYFAEKRVQVLGAAEHTYLK